MYSELRVLKELEEEELKKAELAIQREKKMESFVKEKEQEILQLQVWDWDGHAFHWGDISNLLSSPFVAIYSSVYRVD